MPGIDGLPCRSLGLIHNFSVDSSKGMTESQGMGSLRLSVPSTPLAPSSDFIQIDSECPNPVLMLRSFPGRGTLIAHD